MTSEPTVFVVDDDPAIRDSLGWLVESVGLKAEAHASAHEFLEVYDTARPGCLVLDVRMPRMVLTQLNTSSFRLRTFWL